MALLMFAESSPPLIQVHSPFAEGNFVLINNSITLRGSGPGTTILTRTGGARLGTYIPGANPFPMIILGPQAYNNGATATALTADAH
jgi:hypothetical protein